MGHAWFGDDIFTLEKNTKLLLISTQIFINNSFVYILLCIFFRLETSISFN